MGDVHGGLIEPDPVPPRTFDEFLTNAVLLAHRALMIANDENDRGATVRIFARLVIEQGTTLGADVCPTCGHAALDGDSPTHERHLREERSA